MPRLGDRNRLGAVAAGGPETAAAAVEILRDGGNAFDAALAAMCVACLAEPVLASFGGGGFLLAAPADGDPVLYDFFVHTPRRKRPVEEIDFKPILADFGPATQEFHIGLGATATPGTVAGLFAAHRDLCRLPLERIVEPAVRWAREGITMSPIQSALLDVLWPILTSHPVPAAHFASPADPRRMLGPGEVFRWPGLADLLEGLCREGERLFYEGEIAQAIIADCRDAGHLGPSDLSGYRVEKRRPLGWTYRGADVQTNPPPSTGGALIAFALALIEKADLARFGFGSAGHLQALTRVMHLASCARIETCLAERPHAADEALFDADLLARYRAEVVPLARASRGTTHISIIDREGSAASLTLSNGEGCGHMRSGDGFMLNNMLGEEDLNPNGFHIWPTDCRLSSMMAPTIVRAGNGAKIALGSGGSNRIRSAILQVLAGLIDFGMSVDEAVAAPRIHLEGPLLNIEPGFTEDAIAATAGDAEEQKRWPEPSLFFGGVHAVRRSADGQFEGGGDPRRGGVAVVC